MRLTLPEQSRLAAKLKNELINQGRFDEARKLVNSYIENGGTLNKDYMGMAQSLGLINPNVNKVI